MVSDVILRKVLIYKAKNSILLKLWPFKRQYHKMVSHTQIIRRQIADQLFECAWSFCGVGA